MIAIRRNVLLFHQAALGDFVVTWPIAMAAARLWPTNRVIYVTTPDRGALAERSIGVEWRDVDPTHALFGDGAVGEPTRKLIAGATTIVSFVSTGDDAWATNARRLAPEATLICLRPRPTDDEHVMAFHATQLAASPQLQGAVGQMIAHVAANGAVPRRAGGATVDVLIHPGSGGVAKQWPAERFMELARRIIADGRSVAFVAGEAERERLPLDAFAKIARVIEPRSAVDLFDAIRAARSYVGNDSGPTHLAAMCGIPTLALFGANAPQWRPVGPAVHVVERSPLDSIEVDEIAPIVAAMLDQPATAAATVAEVDD